MTHERAGLPAQDSDLVDVAQLVTAYYTEQPDPDDIDQRVAFGTSGHRGSSLKTAFNEAHILATTQAIVRVPRRAGHRRAAVHRPRHPRPVRAGLGHGAGGARRQRRRRCCVDGRDGYTPTPALSPRDPAPQPRPHRRPGRRHRGHAVAQPAARRRLQVQPAARRAGRHRRHRLDRRTAPTSSSPAGSRACRRIPLARRAGAGQHRHVRLPRRLRRRPARTSSTSTRSATPGVRIGADPLGGAAVAYWGDDRRAARPRPDRGQPAGRPDVAVHDAGLGRQDPDGLLLAVRDGLADRRARTTTDIATGNDADADRHGIVTPDAGLMNPNHYLAVAIELPLRATGPAGPRTPRSARRWSARR